MENRQAPGPPPESSTAVIVQITAAPPTLLVGTVNGFNL